MFGGSIPPLFPPPPTSNKKQPLPVDYGETVMASLLSRHFVGHAAKALETSPATAASAPTPVVPPDVAFPPDRMESMAGRVRDFEALLGAGVHGVKPGKTSLVSSLVESLAVAAGIAQPAAPSGNEPVINSSLPAVFPVSFANQIAVMQRLHALTCDQREESVIPFIKRRVITPGDRMSLVNELVLETLTAIIRATDCTSARVQGPLSALNAMVADATPLALFSDWSPQRCPPESRLAMKYGSVEGEDDAIPVTIKASSSTTPYFPECAIDGRPDTEWRSVSGGDTWDVRFPVPVEVSSVEVVWRDGRAARTVALSVLPAVAVGKSGDDGSEPKWQSVGQRSFTQPVPSVKLSGNRNIVSGLRLKFSGTMSMSSGNVISVQAINVYTPTPSPVWVPTLSVLSELQAWLSRVGLCNVGSPTEDDAHASSLRLAMASGSLEALLKYLCSLLHLNESTELSKAVLDGQLGPAHASAARDAVAALKDAVPDADARYTAWASTGGSESGPLSDFQFDVALAASQSLEFSNNNRTVRSTTGSNTLVLLDRGFSSGVTTWEFRLDHDSNGGECTCFGAATKPITEFSYTSSSAYMYRCYNGQLYGKGKASENKSKIHPNDTIRFEYDADAGTLVVFVNGVSQGVCFSDLGGAELYPAIGFYSSDRTASIVSITVTSSHRAPTSPSKKTAAAAVEAAKPVKAKKSPPPKPADLSAVDNKETAIAIPGVSALMELGFHWHICARAIEAAEGDFDRAAESLFTLEDASVPLRELETRLQAHRQALEKYQEDLKAYEAEMAAAAGSAEPEKSPEAKAADAEPFGSSPTTKGEMLSILLYRLAKLAVRYDPDATPSDLLLPGDVLDDDVPNRPKPSQCAAPADAMDLEVPYCVHVTPDTFRMLETLLRSLLGTVRSGVLAQENALSLVDATLDVIRANFIRLEVAHVDPVDVGLVVVGENQTLAGLQELLLEIMVLADLPDRLRCKAAGVVEAGFQTVFSLPQARADFVGGLIAKQNTTGLSTAEGLLLQSCLKRFAQPSGIVSIIPVSATEDVSVELKRVSTFVTSLLDALSTPGVENSVRDSAVHMLRSFQRHLFSYVVDRHTKDAEDHTATSVGDHKECNEPGWWRRLAGLGWYLDTNTNVTAVVLVEFCRLLLNACATVMDGCSSLLPSDNSAPDAPIVSKIMSTLGQSVVGGLLPAFLAQLALVSHIPWVAVNVLPHAYRVLVRLDSLCSAARFPSGELKPPTPEDLKKPSADATAPSSDSSRVYKGFVAWGGLSHDVSARLIIPNGDGPVSGVGRCLLTHSNAVEPIAIAGTKVGSNYVLTVKSVPVESDSKLVDDPTGSAFGVFRCSGVGNDGGVVTGNGEREAFEGSVSFGLWPSGDSSASQRASWLVDMLVNVSVLFGRMCSVAVRGPHVSFEEEEVMPWLESLVMHPGLSVEAASPSKPPRNGASDGWSAGVFATDWPTVIAKADGRPHDPSPPPTPASAVQADADAFVQSVVSSGHTGDAGSALLAWLQSKTPERGAAARAAKFPEIELLLLCAIARHAGLVSDLQAGLAMLRNGEPLASVPVSANLLAAWKYVVRCRKSLRQQKTEVAAKQGDPTLAEETEQAVQQELKSGDPEDRSAIEVALRKIPAGLPPSVDDWLQAVKERALLLLKLDPITGGGHGESDASQLREKWMALLPASALQPLLQKWQSGDSSGPTRWGGMITVLAKQQSWQRQHSFKSEGSLGSPVSSPNPAPVVAQDNSAPTSDKSLSPLEMIMDQLTNYVRAGSSAPPKLMEAILSWRVRRAEVRAFGLTALANAFDAVQSSAAKQACLMWLRPSLRGVTEREIRTALPSASPGGKDADKPWTLRHHYRVNLEGCRCGVLDRVQAAFVGLFTSLSNVLASAAVYGDAKLAGYVMWTWGCDVDGSDHEFLLRSGMFPSLATKFSMETLRDDTPVDKPARGPAVNWKPWKLEEVRSGLMAGWLSKYQVLSHVASAPDDAVVGGTGISSAVATGAGGMVSSHDAALRWKQDHDVIASDIAGSASRHTVESLLVLLSAMSCYSAHAAQESASTAVTALASEVLASDKLSSQGDSGLSGLPSGKQRRVKPARTRSSYRHEMHEHDLHRDIQRAGIANCDCCHDSVDSTSVAAWSCTPCDFDLCEPCFLAREDHEDWEEPYVTDVTVNGSASVSSPEYIHLQPAAGRRVYADTTDLVFDTIPGQFTNEYVTFIRTIGVDCVNFLPNALTFTTTKPVRVYLGFRDDQRLPDWLERDYVSTSLHVSVTAPLRRLEYVMFESKRIFVPEEDDMDEEEEEESGLEVVIPGAQCSAPPGRVSPSTDDFRNYIVFLEELDDEDVAVFKAAQAESDALVSSAGDNVAKSVDMVSPPRPKHAWLRGGAWSLFRVLMALTAAPVAAQNHTNGPMPASAPSAPRYTDEARKLAFAIVRSELEIGGDALLECESPGKHGRKLEGLEVEALLYSQLQFVLTLSTSSEAKPYVASPDVVKSLLRIFRGGSPRLRRLVLTILRAVCSRLDPRTVDGIVRSVWSPAVVHRWCQVDDTQNCFIGMLLHVSAWPVLLASGVSLGDWAATDGLAWPYGHGGGVIAQALSCEAVALLRTLLDLSGWNDVLAPQLDVAVQEAAGLLGVAPEGSLVSGGSSPLPATAEPCSAWELSVEPEVFMRVAGALAVLGGHMERLHVGGGLRHISGGGVGKVVQYQYGSAAVPLRVTFGTDLSSTVHTSAIDSVSPFPVVPPSPRRAHLSNEALQALTGVLGCFTHVVSSSPLWVQHVCTAAVLAASVIVTEAKVASDPVAAALLHALYDVALHSSPVSYFAEQCDTELQLLDVQARLCEAASSPTTSILSKAVLTEVHSVASPASGTPLSVSPVNGHVSSAENTGLRELNTFGQYWDVAKGLAAALRLSPVATNRAIAMFHGDVDAAKTWLTTSGSMWQFSPVFGKFAGNVTVTDPLASDQQWTVTISPSSSSTSTPSPPAVGVSASLVRQAGGLTVTDRYTGSYDPSTGVASLSIHRAPKPAVDAPVSYPLVHLLFAPDGCGAAVSVAASSDAPSTLVSAGSVSLVVLDDPSLLNSDDALLSSLGKTPTAVTATAGMDELISAISDPSAAKSPPEGPSLGSGKDDFDVAPLVGDSKPAPYELHMNTSELQAAKLSDPTAWMKPRLKFSMTFGGDTCDGVRVGVAKCLRSDGNVGLGDDRVSWAVLSNGSSVFDKIVTGGATPSFSVGSVVTVEVKRGNMWVSVNGSSPKLVHANVPPDVRPAVSLAKPGQSSMLVSCLPKFVFEPCAQVSNALEVTPDADGLCRRLTCVQERPSGSVGIAVSVDTEGAVDERFRQFVRARACGDSPATVFHKMTEAGFTPDDVTTFLQSFLAVQKAIDDSAVSGDTSSFVDMDLSVLERAGDANLAQGSFTLRGVASDPTNCVVLSSPGSSEKGACRVMYTLPKNANLRGAVFTVGIVDGAVPLAAPGSPDIICEVCIDGAVKWSSDPMSEGYDVQHGGVVLDATSAVLELRTRRVGAFAGDSARCSDRTGPAVGVFSLRFLSSKQDDVQKADSLVGATVALLPASVPAAVQLTACNAVDGYTFSRGDVTVPLDSVVVGSVVCRLQSGPAYRVRTLNTETGVTYLLDIPVSRLVTFRKIHGASVDSAAEIRAVLWKSAVASAIASARQGVVHALSSWPQELSLRLAAVGGERKLLSLLKLVAAPKLTGALQDASDNGVAESVGGTSLFDAMKGVLRRVLGSSDDDVDDAVVLTSSLVSDAVTSFVQSSHSGFEPVVRETFHNHPAVVKYGDTITFPGASHVCLLFDKKSNIATSSHGVSFAVYKGPQPAPKSAVALVRSDDAVSTPVGADITAVGVVTPASTFKTLVVPGDTLCWLFESTSRELGPTTGGVSGVSKNYGFKFCAVPVCGHWLTETQVATAPSVDWACWLLQFLLDDVFSQLKPGQVHNTQLFDALLRYARGHAVPPATRDVVVMLMGQLLSTPWMFLPESQPSLEALLPLEELVMKAVADAGKGVAVGMRQLPPRLLHLIELVVQRRAAAGEFASAKSEASSPAKTPVVALSAVESGGSAESKVSEGWSLLTSAAGAVAAVSSKWKRKAAGRAKQANQRVTSTAWSLDAPLVPKVIPSSLKLVEELAILREYAQCFLHGARPSDAVLCSAWCEAFGVTRYVESNHPYRRGEVVNEIVAIPGAKKLRVSLHPQCATQAGTALVLEANGKVVGTFGGPSDAVAWKTTKIDVLGDRVTIKFVVPESDSNEKHFWGIAASVSADNLSANDKEFILKQKESTIGYAFRTMAAVWDTTTDTELCELARRTVEGHGGEDGSGANTMHALPLHRLWLLPRDEGTCPSLAHIPLPLLRLRFAMLQDFNKRLSSYLHCFQISGKHAWTTGALLHNAGHCVFFDVKNAVLEAALQATAGGSYSSIGTVYLSNFDASASVARGAVDPDDSECIFVQAFRSMRDTSAAAMRVATDSSQNKVFEVKFRGEDGIDAGGVYREGLQRMIEDLFSDRFTLMLACPNGARKSGDNNVASYLPNPVHTSSTALEMLVFAGRLMGMSLRFKATLPFMFPSLVWKLLAGSTPTHEDLVAIDDLYAEFIHTIRHCDKDFTLNSEPHAPILNDAAFAEAFPGLTFVVTTSAGTTVDVIPGGSGIPVTFSNRLKYCEAVAHYRLHEFDTQIAALRRGIGHIVPLRVLSLFTWQELEYLVSGRPEIDVEVLKRFTGYEGYTATDKTIKLFWKVFESFTDEERSRYVRFAWGRSRLPSASGHWSSRHKLTHRSGGVKQLPIAHTCFFSVEMPAYQTEEQMRWGLTTAITFGMSGILSG